MPPEPPGYHFKANNFPKHTNRAINQLFNPTYDPKSPDNPPRFADKSMKDSTTGFPSEYSRLTGLSLSIFFDLDAPKKKNDEK